MRRIESTRKQQVVMICATLLAIGSSFPIAMSGKALGAFLWLGASVLAFVMGVTRFQALAKPTLILMLLFAATFVIPVELVLARGRPYGISWARCEVVGLRSYIDRPISSDDTTHVIVRGCVPLLGIEPSRVVKISVPSRNEDVPNSTTLP